MPRSKRDPLIALVALIVATTLVGACGHRRDAAQRRTGPYAVGTRSVTFVDESRPTKAFFSQPAKPDRTIVTDIWYPASGKPSDTSTPDALPAEGSFPLVVFNHGQQGDPEEYAYSLQKWAEAGYVVAGPRHPLTVRGGPGAQFVNDYKDEIEDIPFVITSMGRELPDAVDLNHVAVVGHSSGAIASVAVGFNTCCRDERIDAVVAESVIPFPLDGRYDWGLDKPILFLHGTADASFPIDQGHSVFDEAHAPKFFVPITNGDHSGIFRSGEPDKVATQAVLDFLDRYVKDRGDALDQLRSLRSSPLVQAVEADP